MEQTCVRHTTNLCCILFKLSVKLPAASVPPKVSQHLNSPNRSNTSLMVEVMRMEKTINLRLYINHPIFSKLTIKNTNTQFSISIVFCQSAQMSLKIFVEIMEDTVTTKETSGV